MLVQDDPNRPSPDYGVVRPWPLVDLDRAVPWASTEERGDRCLEVLPSDAKTITTAMRQTDEPIYWRWSGELYRVRPHPMLPHEHSCATLTPYFVLYQPSPSSNPE